jgi:multicomponent Na+:H+ antiporter subunit B
MSRRPASRVLSLVGGVGAFVLLLAAFVQLPDLGHVTHPYGTRAVQAALGRDTANVVSSVNFDQRAFDTMGEEFVLFAAAVSAILLLRRFHDEEEDAYELRVGHHDVWSAVNLAGFALLAPTIMVGFYVVAHGAVSPGGGFQGGALLATGLHLAYLAGDYRVLRRLRPVAVFDAAEAVGAAGFVLLGLSALLVGEPFLTNWLPTGSLGDLASAGTVELFNVAVGMEVASALILLLAKFLDQALVVRGGGGE